MILGATLAVALETGAVIELTPRTGTVLAAPTPPVLADARLQFVAVNTDRTRLLTIGTRKDDSRIIAAWGHSAPAPPRGSPRPGG